MVLLENNSICDLPANGHRGTKKKMLWMSKIIVLRRKIKKNGSTETEGTFAHYFLMSYEKIMSLPWKKIVSRVLYHRDSSLSLKYTSVRWLKVILFFKCTMRLQSVSECNKI